MTANRPSHDLRQTIASAGKNNIHRFKMLALYLFLMIGTILADASNVSAQEHHKMWVGYSNFSTKVIHLFVQFGDIHVDGANYNLWFQFDGTADETGKMKELILDSYHLYLWHETARNDNRVRLEGLEPVSGGFETYGHIWLANGPSAISVTFTSGDTGTLVRNGGHTVTRGHPVLSNVMPAVDEFIQEVRTDLAKAAENPATATSTSSNPVETPATGNTSVVTILTKVAPGKHDTTPGNKETPLEVIPPAPGETSTETEIALSQDSKFNLQNDDGRYLGNYISGSSYYYPKMDGSPSGSSLQFAGGSGDLTYGQDIKIQTTNTGSWTESWKSYNYLGTYADGVYYYDTSQADKATWQIVSAEGKESGAKVLAGDKVRLHNKSYKQFLYPNGAHTSTKTSSDDDTIWTITKR